MSDTNNRLYYVKLCLPSGATWLQTGVAYPNYAACNSAYLKMFPFLERKFGKGLYAEALDTIVYREELKKQLCKQELPIRERASA